MHVQHIARTKWLYVASLIFMSNIWLYHSSTGQAIIPYDDSVGVVVGSLLDLAIVLPLLITLHVQKKSWKLFFLLVISGLVLARLIIPAPLLAPFFAITTAALVAELVFIVIECSVIVLLLYYARAIYTDVKQRTTPLPFALLAATNKRMKAHLLLQGLLQEALVVYYAIAGWRKETPRGYTLYKNSMYIPVMIMILHAIVLEAVAFHWLLHDWLPIVAYVLLAFHIYSVLFVLADMQAMRLTPTIYKHDTWYVSFGLLKRIAIHRDDMKAIHTDKTVDRRQTVYFEAPTFGEEEPHFIVELHEEKPVHFAMGITKHVRYVAIQADDASLEQAMRDTMRRNEQCQTN